MMKGIQKLDKTMEAETVSLLKHLLDLELKRMKEENGIDIVLFMGVDGRVFTSQIPVVLNAEQFHLLNLVKGNMNHICMQLRAENMKFSIQEYKSGTVVISGVGNNAFLVLLLTRKFSSEEMTRFTGRVLNASVVMQHVFEQRPITPETVAGYAPEVTEELQKLSRRLFVEKFDQTRGFKKNMEIQRFLKTKVAEAVGIGNVDEVMMLTFNEMGTSAPYMTDDLWLKFANRLINEHVRRLGGDIIADRCMIEWMPEITEKLKSFL